MNQITIYDLYLMHVQHPATHESNIAVLKSMYEETHNYYISVFRAVLVLLGGFIAALIALLTLDKITSAFAIALFTAAPISLLVPLFVLRSQINQLHRDYLDILQIYNLLSRYF